MFDILVDTFIDSIKLVPFLFVAFLLIELIEHKFSKHTLKFITRAGNFGAIIGAFLGIVPQCGFSVMATNLYVTRIISLGALISVYLSCSDEMIPVMLSGGASMGIVFKILIIKLVVGMVSGVCIDLLFRKKFVSNYEICADEECHCEDSIIKSSFKHTFNILVFIFIVTFIISLVIDWIGDDAIKSFLMGNGLLSIMLSSLIGLVPNCAASVIISEMYLKGMIPFYCTIAGLLSNSGVGMLVLFRENKNIKDNCMVLFLVYFISIIVGVIMYVL